MKSLRLKSVKYNSTALRVGSFCEKYTDWALYVFKKCVHKDEMDIKRFFTVTLVGFYLSGLKFIYTFLFLITKANKYIPIQKF